MTSLSRDAAGGVVAAASSPSFSRAPLPTLPTLTSAPSRLRRTAVAARLATWCSLGALVAGGLSPAPALAQTRPAPSAPAVVNAQVPAGPLADALNRFALQAGVSLVADGDRLAGLRSPGLSGPISVEEGFRRLLDGSGFQASRTPAGFVLTPVRAPAASGAEAATRDSAADITLPRVSVSGTQADSPAGPGPYAAVPTSAATGLTLSWRETPQSITVIGRQKMDDFALETLADALEQTPGLSVTRQGNAIDFRSRGASLNQQTDGVRQINAGWYYLTSSFYALDDMAEIDRIEVLKGSSGLVNGAGYPGGTVNLVRKRPTREFQLGGSVAASSWSNLRGDVDISGPLIEGGALRGRLVAAAADGHTFRDHERKNNQMVYATAEVDLTPATVLGVGLTLRHRELRGMGSTQPIQAYTAGGDFLGLQPRSFNVGADWAGYEQDATSWFARLEHRFANGWQARLHVGRERLTMPEMLIGYLYGRDQAAFNRWTDISTRNETVAFDISGPVELLGRKHELLAGLGYSSFHGGTMRGDGSRVSLAGLGIAYGEGGGALPRSAITNWDMHAEEWNQRQRHGYVAGRFSLADPVKLIAGVRVTDYDQRDVTASWWNYQLTERGVTTPYAGLVVDVSRDISLYGSYASIFQAQTAQDAQGKPLPPEDGLTYEIGAKGEFFDKRLQASLSHFWMKTDNTAEESGESTPSGDAAYRAVNGATRRGYELEVAGEPARGWQVQGSYVMNSSNLASALNTPKHQFKFSGTYQMAGGPLKGVSVGAATRWQSRIEVHNDAATLAQRGYWLIDLMARVPLNRRLQLGLNVANVFDKRYFAGVTDFGALHYTWGAPRSFNVSLRGTY